MTENTKQIYSAVRTRPTKTKASPRVAARTPVTGVDESKITHLRGFGPMTRISTSFGEVPAHVLRERDMVRTRDGGFKQIKWIDRIVLGEDFMRYHPRAQPIVIRAGALGPSLPRAEIMLAPFQPFSKRQMFSGRGPERAVDALTRSSVHRKPEQMITYTLFHCGTPVSVQCEGVWMDILP